MSFFLEKMGIGDWALDRDIFDFKSGFTFPSQSSEDTLPRASKWSSRTASPCTFHIRPGVRWHDKPPMNGRELVADDIVFSFNRMTGLGSDFTEKSPFAGSSHELAN